MNQQGAAGMGFWGRCKRRRRRVSSRAPRPTGLGEAFAAAGKEWVGGEARIAEFGPRHCGPNVVLNGKVLSTTDKITPFFSQTNSLKALQFIDDMALSKKILVIIKKIKY